MSLVPLNPVKYRGIDRGWGDSSVIYGAQIPQPNATETGENSMDTLKTRRKQLYTMTIFRPMVTSSAKFSPASIQGPIRSKRTVSLEDLSPTKEHCIRKSRSTSIKLCPETSSMDSLRYPDVSLMFQRACINFVLNAWRRTKLQLKKLKKLNEDKRSQILHLDLKTCVLRKLLESEKDRVEAATRGSLLITAEMERHIQEKLALKMELETTKADLENLDRKNGSMATETMNLKNEMRVNRVTVTELEKQLQSERLKFAKISDDKRRLVDKVNQLEQTIKEKCSCIEQLIASLEQVEMKVSEEKGALHTLEKELDVFKNELKKVTEDRISILEINRSLQESISNIEEKFSIERQLHTLKKEQCRNHLIEMAELRLSVRTLEKSRDKLPVARIIQVLNYTLRVPAKWICSSLFPFPFSRPF